MTKARDLSVGIPNGLVLIKPTGATNGTVNDSGTVTIGSAVSSVSVNNVFSATYENYLILATYTVGADTDLNFRLRVGGVDELAANYTTIITDNNGALTSGRLTSQTNTRLGPARNGVVMRSRAEIFSPSLAVTTTLIARTVCVPVDNQIGGSHDVALAYDGFTLFPGSSTMTGTISIYGYRK
jgi:hypothetical protein